MFKITKDGATVAMTEAPNYIKQAENGCFVLCPEAEATGIAHNGTVYHLLGRPDMAGAEITVMLDFNPRPREGGDSKDAQFYLRIFDKQVELLRFWGKMRGGCLRNPEKDRRFLGKSLANLPEISGHLDFAGA